MADTDKDAVMVIYTSDSIPKNDKDTLRSFMKKVAAGAWEDFKTTNASTAGKALKFGSGIVGAAPVAQATGTSTPLAWIFSRFGALPQEFTSNGAIQVLEYSKGRRALQMAKAAGIKFVLVTVAFEGGVLAGSVVNQFLSTETKDAIGGTIYEIIYNEGWKELWRHPFGIGLW